jgi:hypothetical protein
MKNQFALLSLLICVNVRAQTDDIVKSQLDSLSKRKVNLENELRLVTQEISVKSKLLMELQNKEPGKILIIKSSKEIGVLDSKSIENGKRIFAIKKNEEFTLLSYENDFYFVDFKGLKGYVYYVGINAINGVEDFKGYWNKKNDERREIAKQTESAELRNQRERERNQREQELIVRFGQLNATRILSNRIWIGMTDGMAQESIGSPDNVNRSNYSTGTQEQWVYKNRYLYFENGVLKSWQDHH